MSNEVSYTPKGAEEFLSRKAESNQISTTDVKNGQNWRTLAECRFEDPELFHLAGKENTPSARKQIKDAKSICANCPVKIDCLIWAVDTREPHSIAGGLTPREREPLLKKVIPTQISIRSQDIS